MLPFKLTVFSLLTMLNYPIESILQTISSVNNAPLNLISRVVYPANALPYYFSADQGDDGK
ncbi:hypothetical protein GA0116948_11914 [Chitinophaga costaii]|uniref:Uncharacterized protein n=1 Tax=Chitinophaga costaii TaxID=1335309 RepID=A0A1C4G1H0_9BACT|nr:hypothetical protein GA0116948_11914 [Chitinophaga costaii]